MSTGSCISNEIIFVKHFVQCLAHSRHYTITPFPFPIKASSEVEKDLVQILESVAFQYILEEEQNGREEETSASALTRAFDFTAFKGSENVELPIFPWVSSMASLDSPVSPSFSSLPMQVSTFSTM